MFLLSTQYSCQTLKWSIIIKNSRPSKFIWLKKWCYVYSNLIKKNNSKNILFLSYESFCENPKLSLNKIINNEEIILKMNFENLKNNNIYIDYNGEERLKAYDIYNKMIKLSE